jgi:hypothetical protein
VPKLAAKSFEKYGFHSAEIMTAWPRVAGAEIAGFTAPERIKWPRGAADPDGTGATGGATLVLRVEPARALDVEYRSAEIIDRINRYFGYRAVASLKLIQAPLLAKDSGAGRAAAGHQPARRPSRRRPTPPAALESLFGNRGRRAGADRPCARLQAIRCYSGQIADRALVPC